MNGKNLKMLNILDRAMADNSSTLYTIELILTKSPIKKIKCGAIVVFRLNPAPELDWNDHADPIEKFELQKELNEMTDSMIGQPEMFKETENRWLSWALPRLLGIFDKLKTEADIVIKSPKLKIRHKINRKEILSLRNDPKLLFNTAFEIDRLLNLDFSFDPWGQFIRRGQIGVDFSR